MNQTHLLDLALLGLLEEGAAHGLDLYHRLLLKDPGLISSNAPIYPRLHHLAARKLIERLPCLEPSRGKPRQLYQITDAGKKARLDLKTKLGQDLENKVAQLTRHGLPRNGASS